ncbi:MAG TPA: efflux RND transporter periplasmic adaptor subunit [Spirochaetota bacterium]|nr:efflux RND transporter periplasmic adaptor subunit [Spirochaetota bacterium]
MISLNRFNSRLSSKILILISFIFILSVTLLLNFCNKETTVKPERGPVVEAIYALGTVKTDKIYNARFGMNTTVRKLYVREGDTVDKGTPLVMGDTSFPLTAPFAGVVTTVNYLENEMAAAGQVILTISSITNLYVKVSLDQESIISIRKGQSAELSFENLRDEKVTGIVEAVYLSGDEFIVRIGAEKFPQGILPQMTCDTAITIRKNGNAMLIPASAVKAGKVDLIRNGKRMTVPVTIKKIDSKKAEVLGDSILPDDKIFISKGRESNKD